MNLFSSITDDIILDNLEELSLSNEDQEFIANTNIEVILKSEIVFTGRIYSFLYDNQFDPSITEVILELKSKEEIQLSEISGLWIIRKI